MSGSAGERFVFKQSYKSRNVKSTKVLNQKHLIYIATRPGVMKNKDCGFGLWGKLPGMDKIDDIESLGAARRLVGEASERRTLYRAILSVDKKTAQQYNLYDREEWEKLLRSKIDILRRGMNIKKENFCWTAAMHYKKNHPHVHILYWDNGNDPRQEYRRKESFVRLSEEIRKALTAAIENEPEIRELQNEQKEDERLAKLQLRAMFKAANLADALDLDHIKPATADRLGRELMELAMELPKSGRLNYDFLPTEYKAKLDAYVEHVLQISDFAKLECQYLDLAADISKLYGNSPYTIDKRIEDARRKFSKALANETLKYLKEVKADLEARSPPSDEAALAAAVHHGVRQLARERPEYKELLSKMPPERTPVKTLMEDESIKRLINELTNNLSDDIRVRVKADALFYKKAAADASKEDKAELGKEINKALRSAVFSSIWNSLCEDKGYDSQQYQDTAIIALLRLFRDISQDKNQMQSRRDLMRESYRNLSETAKKNLRQTKRQEGEWSPEA